MIIFPKGWHDYNPEGMIWLYTIMWYDLVQLLINWTKFKLGFIFAYDSPSINKSLILFKIIITQSLWKNYSWSLVS